MLYVRGIRAEFLIKLKLLIDSLRVPVLPGVPTIPDYSDFPPVSPVFLARCNIHSISKKLLQEQFGRGMPLLHGRVN